ncbi:7101_t:CDS:2 [Paraglomus occultum]|uniref:7101_t:CDS:1 n=1 Tax=Paraglomus occultum TaxID=144539 RepID=A0A9N8ZMG2_9GLOM|nr:7101_t:CDS:2 [Paraglomus occultum]
MDHTISQRQEGLSFLCYFLAGIGNKHISSLKKDIAMFLNHSGASDQAIDTLSNMQLSSTSRENRREKNVISSIHRDNVTRDLVKYQTNAIIVNIDDYHNIHGLRIPTTTSTSTVAHMTTVLAIPIPTTTAIPKNVGDNVYADIHNPRIVDSDILISKIECRCRDEKINGVERRLDEKVEEGLDKVETKIYELRDLIMAQNLR